MCVLWLWLVDMVVETYIDFLISLIPSPLVLALVLQKLSLLLVYFNFILFLVHVLVCNLCTFFHAE